MRQILLTALLFALLALNVEARDRPFVEHDDASERNDLDDIPEWVEGKYKLPDYPDDDDLIEFTVDNVASPFRYFLDGKNITVGNNEVVRYTLVIRSPSGSDNVSYEGIRCNVREVKVYAYGSRGKFHVDANAKWERILLNHSGYRHHNDLREFYFCIPHRHIPYDPEDILRNLKSNPERDQSTGLF